MTARLDDLADSELRRRLTQRAENRGWPLDSPSIEYLVAHRDDPEVEARLRRILA